MSTITSGILFSAQTDTSIPNYVNLTATDEDIWFSHNEAKVPLLRTQPTPKEKI